MVDDDEAPTTADAVPWALTVLDEHGFEVVLAQLADVAADVAAPTVAEVALVVDVVATVAATALLVMFEFSFKSGTAEQAMPGIWLEAPNSENDENDNDDDEDRDEVDEADNDDMDAEDEDDSDMPMSKSANIFTSSYSPFSYKYLRCSRRE